MIRVLFMLMVILFPFSALADSRLDSCLPYQEEISSLLESEDVSSDYFYLAVCESGCRVKTSSKGARGFFQLMPSTYRHYMPAGCTKDDIDNVRCNTIAAARYIKHLQSRFRHVALLVKAYNRGGTNFQRYGTTKEANSLSACVLQYVNSN